MIRTLAISEMRLQYLFVLLSFSRKFIVVFETEWNYIIDRKETGIPATPDNRVLRCRNRIINLQNIKLRKLIKGLQLLIPAIATNVRNCLEKNADADSNWTKKEMSAYPWSPINRHVIPAMLKLKTARIGVLLSPIRNRRWSNSQLEIKILIASCIS